MSKTYLCHYEYTKKVNEYIWAVYVGVWNKRGNSCVRSWSVQVKDTQLKFVIKFYF